MPDLTRINCGCGGELKHKFDEDNGHIIICKNNDCDYIYYKVNNNQLPEYESLIKSYDYYIKQLETKLERLKYNKTCIKTIYKIK
jgi:hypothetical protein